MLDFLKSGNPWQWVTAVFLILILVLLAVFGPGVRRLTLRGLVTVAIMAALSSACGAALTWTLPGLQPSSFIVMMCGIALGPSAGLLCGVTTGILSRLLSGGLGIWAIWQALLWAVMGLTAGLTRRWPIWVQAVIGFGWGFVFGWVMNLMYYAMGFDFYWEAYVLACVSSFTSDLTHALCNAALILLLGKRTLALYKRYGGIHNETGTGS